MSDTPPADRHAATVRRSRVNLVWLIPIVAAIVAAFLGFRTVRDEGPLVTLSFNTGEGLVAGQTKVLHKAVELGQVESVRLSDNMQRVVVSVRMRKEADPYLTDQARFWVVRARLSAGSLSGIETLVTGSYIEMDPGQPNQQKQYNFTGLEQPPGVRSGEPGRTYKLEAERIGSLGPGAPVFYRDILVGEVLGYDIGNGLGPVTINVFVRAPYDDFVREGTHFWNASGLSVQIGSQGIHVELASLQAVLAGGVAFDAPADLGAKPLPGDSKFRLYANYDQARESAYTSSQDFVSYFDSSVRGLGPGAAVEFFGIQVGSVRAVDLDLDPDTGQARARVRFTIQPERIASQEAIARDSPVSVAARLVQRGMRAQLTTASYLTGQKVMALDFVPNAPKAELTREGDDWVVPSSGGGIDNILSALSDISSKLDQLPLADIGANLNKTLSAATGTLTSVQELARTANSGLSPALARLPAITAALQDAATRAGRVFGSLDNSYGYNSSFQREVERAMVQVGDTARSIRLLADFLDRHPEALVRGRANLTGPQ